MLEWFKLQDNLNQLHHNNHLYVCVHTLFSTENSDPPTARIINMKDCKGNDLLFDNLNFSRSFPYKL